MLAEPYNIIEFYGERAEHCLDDGGESKYQLEKEIQLGVYQRMDKEYKEKEAREKKVKISLWVVFSIIWLYWLYSIGFFK